MLYRDFISCLAKSGELRVIDEKIHWSLEAAALCGMTNRVGGPALWFTNVADYPSCSLVGSILTGPGTLYSSPEGRNPWGRLAIALGLNKNIDYESLMEELLARYSYRPRPLLVQSGPCKEELHYGDDVDLFEFPFPLHYQRDPGRYLTAAIVVTTDPSGRWSNWAIYRCLVKGHREVVINAGPGTHFDLLLREYQRIGKPMPCCIVIGGTPAAFIASAFPLGWGEAEAELACGLKTEPVELVKAETNGLLIPSDAEIVIEGEVFPGATADEGPFPEYVRYSPRQQRPLLQVRAVTHRKEPIVPFVAEGCKVSDSMAIRSVLISAYLLHEVRHKTQLRVRWINLPVEAKLSICVAAVHPYYRGHNFWLANFLLARKDRCCFDKVILVDAEINPVDMYEVLNDWAQKTAPFKGRGYFAEEFLHGKTITAAYDQGDIGGTHSIVWDACWPEEWSPDEIRGRVTFETSFPEAVQQQVLRRWQSFGFNMPPTTKKIAKEWVRSPLPQG